MSKINIGRRTEDDLDVQDKSWTQDSGRFRRTEDDLDVQDKSWTPD